MYAVVQTGGKQYRVAVGDVLRVESITAQAGEQVDLDRVLLVGDGKETRIGRPYLEGATVSATVRGHGRGEKLRIFKLRRRQNSRTRTGHRQNYTELEITAIGARDETKKKAPKAKVAPPADPAAPKKKAAARKTATKKRATKATKKKAG